MYALALRTGIRSKHTPDADKAVPCFTEVDALVRAAGKSLKSGIPAVRHPPSPRRGTEVTCPKPKKLPRPFRCPKLYGTVKHANTGPIHARQERKEIRHTPAPFHPRQVPVAKTLAIEPPQEPLQGPSCSERVNTRQGPPGPPRPRLFRPTSIKVPCLPVREAGGPDPAFLPSPSPHWKCRPQSRRGRKKK